MTDNTNTEQVKQAEASMAPAVQMNPEIPVENIVPPTREGVDVEAQVAPVIETQETAVVQENMVAAAPVIETQVVAETTKAKVLSVVKETPKEEIVKKIKIHSERDILKHPKDEVVEALKKSSRSKVFHLYRALHNSSRPNQTVEKMRLLRESLKKDEVEL